MVEKVGRNFLSVIAGAGVGTVFAPSEERIFSVALEWTASNLLFFKSIDSFKKASKALIGKDKVDYIKHSLAAIGTMGLGTGFALATITGTLADTESAIYVGVLGTALGATIGTSISAIGLARNYILNHRRLNSV